MNQRKIIAYFVIVINSLLTHVQTRSDSLNLSEIPKRRWISQLFQEAENIFTMDPNVNDDCFREFLLHKLHLHNQSIWAVKMLESSEWPSVGLFSGRVDHLGNYDECLSISSYGIKGQYCLAQVTYDNLDDNLDNGQNSIENPDQKMSVWEALHMYRSDPIRENRQKLSFALCIPSSCRPNDLKISLEKVLSPIFLEQHLNISVDVNPLLCKTSERLVYPQGYYMVRWLFIIIFLLAISSTYFDIACSRNKKPVNASFSSEICKSFSVVENFRKLKNYNSQTDYVFHFGKFLYMIISIYGHRFIEQLSCPKFNVENMEESWKWQRYLLPHITFVDIFFAITGFLTFHCDRLSMKKGGLVFLFVSIISRWMRMVPAFMLLMLYIIYILPYIGEGPLWHYKISQEVNRCEQSWWTSLLAINNIVKTDQQCLIVSWYIPVDIQLAVIGAVLLYIYSKNEKLAIQTCIAIILGSMILTFLVIYANKYHGMLLFYLTTKDVRKEKEFINLYVATYPRIIPYLFGFLSAFMTKILKGKNYNFLPRQQWLLFFSTLIISEGSVLYASLFYVFGRGYSRLEHALFASLHRALFIFMYVIIFCMYFVSGLGIFTNFLEWKGFAPLGRLTYSVFLINTLIQLYHSASQKHLIMASGTNLMWIFFGDIVLCYVIAFIFHIFVEAPITNISKILKKQILNSFMKSVTKDCNNDKSNVVNGSHHQTCLEKDSDLQRERKKFYNSCMASINRKVINSKFI